MKKYFFSLDYFGQDSLGDLSNLFGPKKSRLLTNYRPCSFSIKNRPILSSFSSLERDNLAVFCHQRESDLSHCIAFDKSTLRAIRRLKLLHVLYINRH